MRPASFLAIVAVAGILTACTRQTTVAGDTAGVRAAINELQRAVNAGDTTALFQVMADDVEVFPPGAEPLKADAARGLFRGMFADASPSLEPFANEEIELSGDLAMQRYSFRLTLRPKAGGTPTTAAGTGLHIWRRGADGRWRLAKDIWTEPPVKARS